MSVGKYSNKCRPFNYSCMLDWMPRRLRPDLNVPWCPVLLLTSLLVGCGDQWMPLGGFVKFIYFRYRLFPGLHFFVLKTFAENLWRMELWMRGKQMWVRFGVPVVLKYFLFHVFDLCCETLPFCYTISFFSFVCLFVAQWEKPKLQHEMFKHVLEISFQNSGSSVNLKFYICYRKMDIVTVVFMNLLYKNLNENWYIFEI